MLASGSLIVRVRSTSAEAVFQDVYKRQLYDGREDGIVEMDALIRQQ